MKIITPEAHACQRIDINPAIHRSHVQPISAPLHVVAVISNPSRFRTRYELFRNFEKYVTDSGAILTTVELALRDRHFEVTTPGPRTVQLRSPDQLWHKENLINIGIRALPANQDVLRIVLAVTSGDATGLEGASMAFKSVDGTKDRVLATYATGTRNVTALDPT